MATKRHKPEEIVTKLRQVEVLVGQGMAHQVFPQLVTPLCVFATVFGRFAVS